MRIFIFITLLLSSCNSKKNTISNFSYETRTVVSTNGNLSVEGNRIVNSKGEVVSFAGNSLFWSNDYYKGNGFYNREVVEWLKDDWNATIIRIPMTADPDIQDSYLYDPKTNEEKLTTAVDAAIALGLYVIIDWHSHRAEDTTNEAITFFEKMARKYGKYPNVIYEIYNEPLKVSWDNTIKPYAKKVIAAIRKIDPDNIIVVGTPHWSQDVDTASNNPITGYSNIAYTLHFYSGSHKEWLINKAEKALENGIALIVTEWGCVDADGNGDVDATSTKLWMDFMRKHNLTHCNWSINDKDEGASALKPCSSVKGGWSTDDLTESGKLAKYYIKNWSE